VWLSGSDVSLFRDCKQPRTPSRITYTALPRFREALTKTAIHPSRPRKRPSQVLARTDTRTTDISTYPLV